MKSTTALATITAGAVLLTSAGVATASSTTKSSDAQRPSAFAQQPTGPQEGLLASEEIGAATFRLSGADRYETAAEVSAAWTPEETVTVFLASGENYPDALSMGASTFLEGPLLLTRRDALPQATIDELDRLQPCFVVVVGGEAAVSDAVALEADSYADPAACGV